MQLLNRVFQGQDSSDLIRQIELACAKYTRMISTLLGDSAGLAIGDSDMLTMLVRSFLIMFEITVCVKKRRAQICGQI